MLDLQPIKRTDLKAICARHKLIPCRGRDVLYVPGSITPALAHKLTNLGLQWERC